MLPLLKSKIRNRITHTFHFQVEPKRWSCKMVRDTQYFQPGKNLNPDDEGKTFFDTAEECKAYCEANWAEAKFFSWNEAESSRKKNREAIQ